ncbi:helix-turn-helix domain-containing protein [Enterococcus mundtii]|nr:helix-turn-helix domain-containing protein [Enterococcus mundtii]
MHLMEIEEDKLDVALKLAELRKSAGLTQKQLAQKLGNLNQPFHELKQVK